MNGVGEIAESSSRLSNPVHGWWFPEKEPWEYGFTESNCNMLMHGMTCDPHTGSEPWRSFLCKIYKV